MLTCFENGFETPTKEIEIQNKDNTEGAKCIDCSIATTCQLKIQNQEYLCFEALRRMLIEKNIFERFQNGETLPELEQSIYENINGMLYLLKTKPVVKPYVMAPWERMDLATYYVQPNSPLGTYGKKYGVICRMFGRQCMQILRDRGYGFEQ